MGVLNVTPDSFSDGSAYADLDRATAHAVALADDGAAVIDVGGESTRPGARRVSEGLELCRVLPVITALVRSGIAVSVDTTRASVARAALGVGALMVNDVSGGLADPEMAHLIAEADVPYVVSHWRAHSDVMHRYAKYDDVVDAVGEELSARVDALVAAGVRRSRLIIDPGLGFSKTAQHNWTLIAHLDALTALGLPILLGASRKSFLRGVIPPEPDMGDLDAATAVLSALVAPRVAWLRVHNVALNAMAVRTSRRAIYPHGC